MRAAALAISLALSCTIPFPLATAAPEAVLRLAQPAADEVLAVGSLVTLEASISGDDHEGAWTITGAEKQKWLAHGPLLLDLTSLGSPAERENQVRIRAVITQSGSFTVPPLVLQREAGQQRIETNPLALNAQSALGPEDKEPIWVLPLLPYGSWDAVKIGLICLTILATLAGVIAFFVNRFRRRSAPAALTPHEKAKREIAALETFLAARPELGIEECKKFSFDLSALLRRYVSEFYAADFLDLTDIEVARKAEEIGIDRTRRDELNSILAQIAEVRYSRKLIAAAAALSVLQRAEGLVKALAPPPTAGKERSA